VQRPKSELEAKSANAETSKLEVGDAELERRRRAAVRVHSEQQELMRQRLVRHHSTATPPPSALSSIMYVNLDISVYIAVCLITYPHHKELIVEYRIN